MQPTYLPWIGYFDMIDRVDTFVFLDSVQFASRSWQQRNRVKGPQGECWLVVPVLSKGRRDQTIEQVEIDTTQAIAEKHLKAISLYYRKTPHFAAYFEDLSALYRKNHRRLADLNIELILWLCTRFGIQTPTLRSSTLPVEGKKTELLVSICKSLKAEHYLSAEGSRQYIEENNLFKTHGIGLSYHSYNHPPYRQLYGAFLPYMGALDLLFNEGPASLAVIQSGRTAATALSQ
ncbi:MAG: WbqC family protein [Elusimicrobiota bacterium]|jgi:hypothetical protein